MAISATIAILIFTAGTMGYFLTRSRIYESIALIAIAFALFRPDYFMNRIQPPFEDIEPAALVQTLDAAQAGDLRIVVSGPDFDTGETKETTLVMPVEAGTPGQAQVDAFGLMLLEEDGVMKLDEPMFGTPVSSDMESFDFYADDPVQITSVRAPADQMPKELVFIPALALLALIVLLQTARARKEETQA